MNETSGRPFSRHVSETLLHIAMLHRHKQIRILWLKDQGIFILFYSSLYASLTLQSLIVILWGEVRLCAAFGRCSFHFCPGIHGVEHGESHLTAEQTAKPGRKTQRPNR